MTSIKDLWPLNTDAFREHRPVTSQRHGLTTKEPRIRDSRFLQTGRRISRQLKLRTAAGALAQANADWDQYKTTRIYSCECVWKLISAS